MPERVCPDALRRRDPDARVVTLAGRALGTGWQVRLVVRPGVDPARVAERIEARLAAIVGEMSQWELGSRLSQFNRAPAGLWLALPPDFATVVAAALDLAGRTGGAFDPTLGRVAALLGYGAEPPSLPPSGAALDAAAAAAGWRRLAFDPAGRRLRQPGGLWLDLSGIGKGFAVDAVADLLRGDGIADALVEIGGELAGRGLKPDGQPWWVDLELPPGAALPSFRIGLHELAVATSGSYVRGAHTLDPRTGRALPPEVVSVSVVHRSAMMADGWATALTVLGPVAGEEAAVREGISARMIWCQQGQFVEWMSPALRAITES